MDQLFRLADILSPAVTALLGDLEGERRRARERYAQSGPLGGRYGDIARGWAGQAAVLRARLTKEVLATRLDSSAGQELKDLAKSEYLAELLSEPRKAVGEFTFRRVLVNDDPSSTGQLSKGTIPAGTRLKRVIGSALRFPAQDSEFVTTAPVACGADDDFTSVNGDNFNHIQDVVVPVEATREGPHANLARFNTSAVNPLNFSIESELFDPLFTVLSAAAAGGTLGVVDEQIRALARAMATGNSGPTAQAVVAGALTNTSVRYAAYVNNAAFATGLLFAADESWASSAALEEQVLRDLRAYPWIGWGCKVVVSGVVNVGVIVRPTVMLRDRAYEPATAEITESIRVALQDYFDDRPDWYTWTTNAVGAVVGGADDRIMACTDVVVLDQSGEPLDEPPAEIDPNTSTARHFQVIDQGVEPIYQLPGD
jgi:hypothetical protein